MTTWLESTNVHQDGTPVTRKIKIPEMGEEIWFTDNAYAEVSNDVADILANNIDSISKLASAPSSPGTYYGDANSNTTIQVNVSDGSFDALTAESIASDAISSENAVSGTFGVDYGSVNPQTPRQPEAQSPLQFKRHPAADNPVITLDMVDDVTMGDTKGVADPFMVYESGKYHIFAELLIDEASSPADYRIGHFESDDGLNWTYNQVVLNASDKSFAYPFVFKHGGEWYMCPQNTSSDLILYKADSFPGSWSEVARPITGAAWAPSDPDILYLPDLSGEPYDSSGLTWDGTFWLFIDDNTNDTLRLFYSDLLETDDWTEHSSSPISSASATEKLAGRPMVGPNHIDLFHREYFSSGEVVNGSRITELSKTSVTGPIEWDNNPVIQGSKVLDPSGVEAFHNVSTHHVDIVTPSNGAEPIAVVDGQAHDSTEGELWYELGIYTVGEAQPRFLSALSADQSISSGSFSTIQFNNLRGDTHNGWDSTNYEYVTPKSGWYHIEAKAMLNPASADTPFRSVMLINLTGRNTSQEDYQITAGGQQTVSASGMQWIPKGTAVTAQLFQDSGTSQTVLGNKSGTFMDITYMGE